MTVTGMSRIAGRLDSMRVLPVLLAAAFVSPTWATSPVPCEARPTGNGSADVVCKVEPGATVAELRFSARFGGVHDDSEAGLAASIDGAPLPCAEGGITRIGGDQDGDALVCRFTLPAQARAARAILIHLLWFHAEPVGYDMTRE